jgi:hypothetical protein
MTPSPSHAINRVGGLRDTSKGGPPRRIAAWLFEVTERALRTQPATQYREHEYSSARTFKYTYHRLATCNPVTVVR